MASTVASGAPKAVLFDYDDTLVQTRQCKYRALKALALRHYAVELTDEQIDAHWGIAYAELFRRLFAHLDADLSRVMARYEALDSEFAMTAYPETLAVLAQLATRCPIGIVTAAGRSIVQRQLQALGLPLEGLTVLQTAEDTQYHKPDPRVFEPAVAILAARGVNRANITYVGDSINDYAAARDAGLAFVGVLRGTTSPAAFVQAGAVSVESLDALLDIV